MRFGKNSTQKTNYSTRVRVKSSTFAPEFVNPLNSSSKVGEVAEGRRGMNLKY